MSADVTNGNLKTFGDLEVPTKDVGIASTRALKQPFGYVWKLSGGELVTFTFHLPEKAQNVKMKVREVGYPSHAKEILFFINDEQLDETVKSAQPKTRRVHQVDLAGKVKVGKNIIEVGIEDGKLGLQHLSISYDLPHVPATLGNGMSLTVLSPVAGQVVSTDGEITILWESKNLPADAMVAVQCREGNNHWKAIADWIPYNYPSGQGNLGSVQWKPKSVANDLQFRVLYRGDQGDIFNAVKTGNLQKVKELLKANPEFASAKDATGKSLFIIAREHGHTEIAALLSFATLEVKSEPPGAMAYVDGKKHGVTPTNISVDTGANGEKTIEVTLQSKGYETKRGQVKLQAGSKASLETKLEERKLPTRITGEDGAPMVLIPAGEFWMGSNNGDDDEKPVHTVYLDAYYIDVYEVTNALFKKFLEANSQWRKDRINREYHDGDYLEYWNGMNYPSGKADHPVVYVSWYAAAAYAQWAGKRLPTEAEWEKAARGGLVGTKYPRGDTLSHDNANYRGTGGIDRWNGTSPVSSFPANSYGLYDMAGNVWEWCADEFNSGYYSRSPKNNPKGPGAVITFRNNNFTNVKSRRVLRGGGWYLNDTRYLRCASRDDYGPSLADLSSGFRCAQDL